MNVNTIIHAIIKCINQYMHKITIIMMFCFVVVFILYGMFQTEVTAFFNKYTGTSPSGISLSFITAASIVIVNRLFSLEKLLSRDNTQLGVLTNKIDDALAKANSNVKYYTVHMEEGEAYDTIVELIKGQSAHRIDMVQLSGRIAWPLINKVVTANPHVQIRLLLLHDDIVEKFDKCHPKSTPDTPYHTHRRNHSIKECKWLEDKHKDKGVNIDIRYYRSYPGPYIVIVDEKTFCIGWYVSYIENNTCLRIRSDNVPGLVFSNQSSVHLTAFAREHFDRLWKFAETDPNGRAVSKANI